MYDFRFYQECMGQTQLVLCGCVDTRKNQQKCIGC
jgi:hypothetical protein